MFDGQKGNLYIPFFLSRWAIMQIMIGIFLNCYVLKRPKFSIHRGPGEVMRGKRRLWDRKSIYGGATLGAHTHDNATDTSKTMWVQSLIWCPPSRLFLVISEYRRKACTYNLIMSCKLQDRFVRECVLKYSMHALDTYVCTWFGGTSIDFVRRHFIHWYTVWMTFPISRLPKN